MTAEVFRTFEGLYLSKNFHDDAVRSTLAYKPQPEDLFLAAYPKSGSTWMQRIIYYILMDGEDPEDPVDSFIRLPLLEMRGADAALYAPRPAVFRTHLPFHLVPYSSEAKYIYIARNPYDTCFSFYYHTRNIPSYKFQNGTFEEFFELFLNGKVDFGDYFESVLSCYKHRNDKNLLFLTYEELTRDTPRCILKIAAFIDAEKEKKMETNPVLMSRILEKTNLKHMEKHLEFIATQMAWKESPLFKTLRPELLNSFKNSFRFFNAPMTGNFVRKGKVGDWKNHFSLEQVRKMKSRIADEGEYKDVMSLWKDVCLP